MADSGQCMAETTTILQLVFYCNYNTISIVISISN